MDLDHNTEFQDTVTHISHYFDLHGQEDWVEWAAPLMPVRVAELETQRVFSEQVKREAERAEFERTKMEEMRRKAAESAKIKTVSAHISFSIPLLIPCFCSLRFRCTVLRARFRARMIRVR